MVTLVDVYADWCQPCKVMAPILEKVTSELGVELEKVDAEAQPEVAASYEVRSIPTMIVMKDGVEMDRLIGMTAESVLKEAIQKHL